MLILAIIIVFLVHVETYYLISKADSDSKLIIYETTNLSVIQSTNRNNHDMHNLQKYIVIWPKSRNQQQFQDSFSLQINITVRCLNKPIQLQIFSQQNVELHFLKTYLKPPNLNTFSISILPSQKNISCNETIFIKIFIRSQKQNLNYHTTPRIQYTIKQDDCCSEELQGFHFEKDSCKCQTVCGDGILIKQFQECDDGNSASGDGCSSSCKIQKHFFCTAATNKKSICKLQLQLKFLNYYKSPYANIINIRLNVFPNLSEFSRINFSRALQNTESGDKILSYSYNPQLNPNLLLQYQFSSPYIYTLKFKFDSENISLDDIKVLNTYFWVEKNKSPPNLNLHAYSRTEYDEARKFQNLYQKCFMATFFIFLIGIKNGKLITLELLGIYQFSVFSLLQNNNLNPFEYALFSGLRLSTGFHWLGVCRSQYENTFLNLICFRQDYFENVINLVLFPIIALIVLGLYMKAASLKPKLLISCASGMLSELYLSFVIIICPCLVFCVMNRLFSVDLELRMEDYFITGIAVFVISMWFIVYCYFQNFFVEFSDKNFSQNYNVQLMVLFMSRLLFGIFIWAQFLDLFHICFIFMGWIIIYVKDRPYKCIEQNIGCVVNMSAGIVVCASNLLKEGGDVKSAANVNIVCIFIATSFSFCIGVGKFVKCLRQKEEARLKEKREFLQSEIELVCDLLDRSECEYMEEQHQKLV